jgi:acyl-CoA synthetase (AMP-forming)/AMP-acid ligase II
MTETISQTHINPPQRPKQQCLGISTFDTESLVIDPEKLRVLGAGEPGEIVVRGPQLLTGYWKNEKAYRESWVEIEGRSFFRTGDLGRTDEDGFFYISDRLKRMINAAGLKVWPAEVEATMYRHPACTATPRSRSAASSPPPTRAVAKRSRPWWFSSPAHARVAPRSSNGRVGRWLPTRRRA